MAIKPRPAMTTSSMARERRQRRRGTGGNGFGGGVHVAAAGKVARPAPFRAHSRKQIGSDGDVTRLGQLVGHAPGCRPEPVIAYRVGLPPNRIGTLGVRLPPDSTTPYCFSPKSAFFPDQYEPPAGHLGSN